MCVCACVCACGWGCVCAEIINACCFELLNLGFAVQITGTLTGDVSMLPYTGLGRCCSMLE